MGILSSLFGKKSNKTEYLQQKSFGQLAFLEVDMHNHILPGIDDGSQSVEQSLSLLNVLQHVGFSKFICTPHIMDGVHPNDSASIGGAHKQLTKAIADRKLGIDVLPAAEHMIDGGLQRMIGSDKLMVMPGNYVLIEMSYLAESKALFQTILDIQNLGYKPVLAHPERYSYYHFNPEMYKQIKNSGCLLQLNLLSISRYYGSHVKNAAHALIKEGMYDFVGTDAHHEKHVLGLKDVVSRYAVQELLSTCNILNPTLSDHINDLKAKDRDKNTVKAG